MPLNPAVELSSHLARETHGTFSGADWSTRLVREALLHPMSVRLYAELPFLPELFHNDLQRRIIHPKDTSPSSFSRPLYIHRDQKNWFVPGSANDLILYTSCWVACCHALIRSIRADADSFDCGPPLMKELAVGSFGLHPMMLSYWARLGEASRTLLANPFRILVVADVARCAESMEPEQLLLLLSEAGASQDAIRVLTAMHGAWQEAGCQGLPLTAGFGLAIKLYLNSVDDRLHSEGITFLRLQDDFRLFCESETEAHRGLRVLSGALAERGLTLNDSKSAIFSTDALRRSWKLRQINWCRTLGRGVAYPALADATQHRALRPLALPLLRLLYGRRCTPA